MLQNDESLQAASYYCSAIVVLIKSSNRYVSVMRSDIVVGRTTFLLSVGRGVSL